MSDAQLQPDGKPPSPARQGALIGLSIGLAFVSAKVAGEVATKSGAGDVAAWFLSLAAAVVIATLVAVVGAKVLGGSK